ncbi:MAG: lipopolysaccharide assembly protein LapB [Legionellales bacterium]|nr:lipopolysaccharide assembly protein LapB [Legionellales bacterium]
MNSLFLLLLPVAAASGWYFAKRTPTHKNSHKPQGISHRDYFVGLNYLLNEEPDKAVDIFIKMIEVDSDTVETHLALGNLFRRRGEVERAIRIHQNLIARPHLQKEHRIQALLELGQDYLRAGVFDRAERLFLEVLDMGEHTTPSLQHLLHIYQQEKDWEQAISVAQQLEKNGSQDMQPVIAHYYCEMAERALAKNNTDSAQRSLKRALAVDRNNVRASLLQAHMELTQGKYKAAIRCYKRVKNQDSEFLSEAILPLVHCYEQLQDESEMIDFLRQCLDEHPRISVVLIFTERLLKTQGEKAASEFLAEQLQRRPSVRGLKHLIEIQLKNADGRMRDNLTILRDVTRLLLENKPIYRCRQCGFAGKTLQWQCPTCKNWNTVKPIHGLEGD